LRQKRLKQPLDLPLALTRTRPQELDPPRDRRESNVPQVCAMDVGRSRKPAGRFSHETPRLITIETTPPPAARTRLHAPAGTRCLDRLGTTSAARPRPQTAQ